MLVLTRRVGQAITIGDDVEVFVLETRGDQVRLGIRAPRHVPVLRTEVLDAIQQENRQAAEAGLDIVRALDTLATAEETPSETPEKMSLKPSAVPVENKG